MIGDVTIERTHDGCRHNRWLWDVETNDGEFVMHTCGRATTRRKARAAAAQQRELVLLTAKGDPAKVKLHTS